MERPYSDGKSVIPRVAELVLCIAKRYRLKIVQVCAPTTSYSVEDINNFYDNVGEILGKTNHYMIVIGDVNAEIIKRINPMETATGKCELELRNERGDTLVEWETSRKYNHVSEESREEMDMEKPKWCNEGRN